MAAKKAASKKRKKVAKKSVTKKTSAKKKSTARKKVAKKKVAKKVSSAKKVAKKVAKKASARKTTSKKKAAAKSGKKKAAKKAATKKKSATRKTTPARSRGDVLSAPIHGIDPYSPKRGEEYMSDEQLEHFREILNAWKRELMYEVDRTVHHMQDEAANFPDPNDRATQESEFGLELRTRDRERKLLRKIDSAIARLDDGS